MTQITFSTYRCSTNVMFLQRALATGLMELVEALIDPSKTDQECSAILMPVPPAFIGKSYNEAAMMQMESGATPIGVLRCSTGPHPYVLACTPSSKEVILSDDDGIYGI